MKVLGIGNGGREHALVSKLAESPLVEQVYATRPNAGMALLVEPVDLAVDDIAGLLHFAESSDIGLTVVGPELPLTLGVVDAFEARGLKIWGPNRAGARLEGSKAFAKEVMTAASVPTAAYGSFEVLEEAIAWTREFDRPVAVKADGLAAGKGVILCHTPAEAEAALRYVLGDGAFGTAGHRVVVEELLLGEEASFIALCDGETVVPLASSQDHKRIGEGDTGLNTGGMGAYSPAPVVTPAVEEDIMATVMLPVARELKKRGIHYRGFLYAGLMFTAEGPRVLEFNVRLGDPETQPLMMRLESDLVDILLSALDGRLQETDLRWDSRPAICVVMASEGYPEAARKGDVISGLGAAAAIADVMVVHAGTRRVDGEVIVSGGRVLGITARGDDLQHAAHNAYRAVDCIQWPGCQVRRDIGWRALARHEEISA